MAQAGLMRGACRARCGPAEGGTSSRVPLGRDHNAGARGSTIASSLSVASADQSSSKRSTYGSRVPSFAKPRLTMYAAATHEAYRQPSAASRSASPTYTAIKIATMAAIVSMNSVVLKPALLSVKVLRCP